MQQGEVVANLDWLAVSVRFASVPDWSAVSFAGCKHRVLTSTNVWHDRVCVFNEYGDKLATILARPRSSQLFETGAGLIEVANEWLYHGCGWPFVFDLVGRAAPFELLGVSRVDFCADFCPASWQQAVILGLSSGEYYVGGKSSGSEFWTQTTPDPHLADWTFGKRVPHCQSWGHKTSAMRWKLYYKTRELYTVEDKPYIRDQWESAGFDVRNVWRLECSLHYPHQLNINDRPITYEDVSHDWLSLLRTFYQSRFVVRKAEGHKDRSNDKRIDLLPALSVGGCQLRCKVPINESRRNGRISLLRHLAKSVADEAVLLNDNTREGVFALIEQIVHDDGLESYFQAMVGDDLYSWIESVRVDAYTLCGGRSS